ncbi:hypothetical protein FRB93_010417 [Tulasnella sp. JGI-2019a]|nr:hypothetical protein FRB93_010417 [Tulasnella sp. JGI-2019a]
MVWRQVRVASVAQAVSLGAILANKGTTGRIANSILFVTVDSIGKESLEPSTVSQDLVNKIVQRCVNLRRLAGPILNFKSVIQTAPFLPHLQSLSISNFSSLARKVNLPIANVLAGLSTLIHLDIDAELLFPHYSPVSIPLFSLSSLSWAGTSMEKLEWILQNSLHSLETLTLLRSPGLTGLSELLEKYGKRLASLRLRIEGGGLSKTDLVKLDLRERCTGLREILISTSLLPSFLSTLPISIQHVAFSPSEDMELWWTGVIDEWICKHPSLQVLSLTGHWIHTVENFATNIADVDADGTSEMVAKQYDIVGRWSNACRKRGMHLRLYTCSNWPWSDSLERDFESPVCVSRRFR